jgi:two-component system, NarL family, response regulator LiaR
MLKVGGLASRQMAEPLRVAVINDFELVVRGLETMLYRFRDRVRVVELDVRHNPTQRVDIALFDTYGQTGGGVERVKSLAADRGIGAVVVFCWSLPAGQVETLIASGARGVLSKSITGEALANTLLAIHTGEIVVSPTFSRPQQARWPGSEFGLTTRESEVAALLIDGLANQEIASSLFISEHTVKSHLKAIFNKTASRSRTQVIALLTSAPDFRRLAASRN